MKKHTVTNFKRSYLLIFAALFLAVSLLGCTGSDTVSKANTSSKAAEPETMPEYKPDSTYGSAVTMEGKTLLISIFTTDKATSWNFENADDKKLVEQTHEKLRIAADFLHGQAACYDKEFSLIYDWKKSDDLLYKANIDESLVREDSGGNIAQTNWIKENIDLSALVHKYKADGVVFIFYFNTDMSNTVNPWELSRIDGEQIPLEFCNFYLKFDGFDMTAASFAHEIMHAFGAKDLYYPSEGIPEKFVKYLEESVSNDIMYTVADDDKIIPNDFTELDAYYVGIAPRPDIANEWNLALSEHDKN